jgi:hypothetical protein
MEQGKKTFTTTGKVSSEKELHLDAALPFLLNSKVKVTISFDDDGYDIVRSALKNPAFKNIFDTSEDVYTLEDGKPFNG